MLPAPELFLAFLIAGLALNITPGADMTFVASAGARGGVRGGLAAAAGIWLGCFAHILFATVGLTALLAASPTAYAVMKLAGAAYLIYMAIMMVWPKKEAAAATQAEAPKRLGRIFRQAALVNVLNPKVGVFFLAFLPQFLDAPAGYDAALQTFSLGMVFNMTGLMVNGLVGTIAALGAARMGQLPLLKRAARYVAATILGGFAVKLSLS